MAGSTVATATETIATATETVATATETVATVTETVATATETVATATETVATVTETVATATETVVTATDATATGAEISSKAGVGLGDLVTWTRVCSLLQIVTSSYFAYGDWKTLQELNEFETRINGGFNKNNAIKNIAPDVYEMKKELQKIRKSIQDTWG